MPWAELGRSEPDAVAASRGRIGERAGEQHPDGPEEGRVDRRGAEVAVTRAAVGLTWRPFVGRVNPAVA